MQHARARATHTDERTLLVVISTRHEAASSIVWLTRVLLATPLWPLRLPLQVMSSTGMTVDRVAIA